MCVSINTIVQPHKRSQVSRLGTDRSSSWNFFSLHYYHVKVLRILLTTLISQLLTEQS